MFYIKTLYIVYHQNIIHDILSKHYTLYIMNYA